MIRKAVIGASSLGVVVTAVLWVAGHLFVVEVSREFDMESSAMLLIHDGRLLLLYSTPVGGLFEIDVSQALGPVAPGTAYVEHRFLGAGVESLLRNTGANPTPRQYRETCLNIPMWWPLAAFSVLPSWSFLRGPVRRWRRRRKGWCLACGYNLSGNITGVCSECGARVPRRTMER